MWTDLSSVLSQCTRVTDGQTDGQTDRRTEFSSLYRVCITCSAVKIIRFCAYTIFDETFQLIQTSSLMIVDIFFQYVPSELLVIRTRLEENSCLVITC